jgi:hypothetical protein
MRTAVVQDSPSPTWYIDTLTPTAGNNATAVYQVTSSVIREVALLYDVRTAAQRDLATLYQVNAEVTKDFTDTWDLASSAYIDGVATYQVIGKTVAERGQILQYDINAASNQVPNVIGMTLSAATKKLTRAGFALGTVTYQ